MVAAAAGAGGHGSAAFELAGSSLSSGQRPGPSVATTRFAGEGNPLIRIGAAGAKAASATNTKRPRMSRRLVARTVLAIMADSAGQLGRSLAKPQIISMTFVRPGKIFRGGSHTFWWWSVHAQGTFMSCGATTCGLASRGTLAIADATGCEAGGVLEEPVTIIPVDQVKLRPAYGPGPFCHPVLSPAKP